MTVNISGSTGQIDKLQFDDSGNLKVNSSGGGGTVNQGTPNTLANAWPVEVTDGTNILGTTANPISTGSNATISSGNSTNIPLGANATFTGSSIDLLNFSTLRVSGDSDVGSATNGLQIQFSNDGVNWDFIRQTTFSPAVEGFYAVYNRVARYARVVYTNGATPQTFFRMQTVVVPNSAEFQRRFISEIPADQNTAILTQSVIVGKTTGGGGGYVAVKVNPLGTLTADVSNSTNVGVTGTVSTKTNLTSSAPSAASVGVASAQVLAANVNRKGLILVNTSSNIISVGLGSAAVLNSGITLVPYGSFTMDEYCFNTGAVNAIASAASSNLAIQEFAA